MVMEFMFLVYNCIITKITVVIMNRLKVCWNLSIDIGNRCLYNIGINRGINKEINAENSFLLRMDITGSASTPLTYCVSLVYTLC